MIVIQSGFSWGIMLVKVIYITLFLLMSSCYTTIIRHGYPISEVNLWDKIKVGDSENQVIQLIGDPSITEGDVWYYVSYNIYKKRFFSAKEYESLVLKLTFDNETKEVMEVKHIKIEKRELIKLLNKHTPVTGIHDSLLRQFGSKLV